jgi:hypothetical protein
MQDALVLLLSAAGGGGVGLLPGSGLGLGLVFASGGGGVGDASMMGGYCTTTTVVFSATVTLHRANAPLMVAMPLLSHTSLLFKRRHAVVCRADEIEHSVCKCCCCSSQHATVLLPKCS